MKGSATLFVQDVGKNETARFESIDGPRRHSFYDLSEERVSRAVVLAPNHCVGDKYF